MKQGPRSRTRSPAMWTRVRRYVRVGATLLLIWPACCAGHTAPPVGKGGKSATAPTALKVNVSPLREVGGVRKGEGTSLAAGLVRVLNEQRIPNVTAAPGSRRNGAMLLEGELSALGENGPFLVTLRLKDVSGAMLAQAAGTARTRSDLMANMRRDPRVHPLGLVGGLVEQLTAALRWRSAAPTTVVVSPGRNFVSELEKLALRGNKSVTVESDSTPAGSVKVRIQGPEAGTAFLLGRSAPGNATDLTVLATIPVEANREAAVTTTSRPLYTVFRRARATVAPAPSGAKSPTPGEPLVRVVGAVADRVVTRATSESDDATVPGLLQQMSGSPEHWEVHAMTRSDNASPLVSLRLERDDPAEIPGALPPNTVGVGDLLFFSVKVAANGFLVVVNETGRGVLEVVFPKGKNPSGAVVAGRTYRIPEDDLVALRADTVGTERVSAYLFRSETAAKAFMRHAASLRKLPPLPTGLSGESYAEISIKVLPE